MLLNLEQNGLTPSDYLPTLASRVLISVYTSCLTDLVNFQQ